MDFRNLVNRRAWIELEYRILDLEGTSLPKGDIYSPPLRANIGQFPKQLLRHRAPPGSQPASRGRDGAPRQARTPQGRSGDEELRGV